MTTAKKTETATSAAKPPAKVTPKVDKTPVNIEIESKDEEPTPAPVAQEPEKIQTDVREKLGRKTEVSNPFVPTNPADVEKSAEKIAEEQGFALNRGTSIGARLMARRKLI
jgi:hypothetical protein